MYTMRFESGSFSYKAEPLALSYVDWVVGICAKLD